MTTNSTRKLNSQPNKCHSRECASFTFAPWRLIFIRLLCYYRFFFFEIFYFEPLICFDDVVFILFVRLFRTPLIRCGCECVCVAVFRCLYYRVFDMNFEVWLFIVIILCFVSLELFDDWSFFPSSSGDFSIEPRCRLCVCACQIKRKKRIREKCTRYKIHANLKSI